MWQLDRIQRTRLNTLLAQRAEVDANIAVLQSLIASHKSSSGYKKPDDSGADSDNDGATESE